MGSLHEGYHNDQETVEPAGVAGDGDVGHSGVGVVADSDPAAERRESDAKAEVLVAVHRAFGAPATVTP